MASRRMRALWLLGGLGSAFVGPAPSRVGYGTRLGAVTTHVAAPGNPYAENKPPAAARWDVWGGARGFPAALLLAAVGIRAASRHAIVAVDGGRTRLCVFDFDYTLSVTEVEGARTDEEAAEALFGGAARVAMLRGLLEELSGAAHLAVCSYNYSSTIRAALRAVGLNDYFDDVIGRGELDDLYCAQQGLPPGTRQNSQLWKSVGIRECLAKKLGVDREAILFVDDDVYNVRDVEQALAGCEAIHCSYPGGIKEVERDSILRWSRASLPAPRARSAAARMSLPDDDELLASLRKRTEETGAKAGGEDDEAAESDGDEDDEVPESSLSPVDEALLASLKRRTLGSALGEDDARFGSSAPPPLGPGDVGADKMGPQDVISYCLRAMAAEQNDAWPGLKVLMSFAAKQDEELDGVGQVQPGYFRDPGALAAYFRSNPRYETLNRLSEWKPMGPPQMSNMARIAEQKLLVRRANAKWEEFFVNMQLAETKSELAKKRWLITSIYKKGTADDGFSDDDVKDL